MNNESKALELARELSMQAPKGILTETHAAAELRRQHAALQDLQTECAALRVNEENLTAQVESLRAQLAARVPVAQGEPVGFVDAVSEHGFHVEFSVALPVGTKLYTLPQQASEPMTEAQIQDERWARGFYNTEEDEAFEAGVRFAEHHHQIKGKQ